MIAISLPHKILGFIALLVVLFIWHSIDKHYAVEEAKQGLVEKSTIVRLQTELEAQQELNRFERSRVNHNENIKRNYERLLNQFNRQKESDYAFLRDEYDDTVNEILSGSNHCVVNDSVLKRLRNATGN
jgi:hypothetical protein